MDLEANLIAYYEAESAAGTRGAVSDFRRELYERFRTVLRREQRSRLLDVGAGPGTDTANWREDGFPAIGVDLAFGHAARMRERDVPAAVASLHHLPFASASFDSLWTMSTFVHVPDASLDTALAELVRVVAPGAPLGIGTWGGLDFEGVPEFGEHRPYRFFALRSHDRWRRALETHGEVEELLTYERNVGHDWQYQFAILRAPR